MSLDRWFGKDLTNITPPGSEDTIKCTRPVPRRALAKRVGPRIVVPFKPSTKSAGGNITSICTLANHDVSFFGLWGSVVVRNTEKVFGTVELGKYPVRSMCASSGQLVACSENSVDLIDIATSKIKSTFVPDNAFGFNGVAQNKGTQHQLLVTSKNGSSYLCDLRTNATTKIVHDAHDPQRRLKRGKTPRGPALTAATWVGEHFATGSVQDNTVKFWDVRKSSVPCNEVKLRGTKGGICSLASDDEHKLWALDKSGSLESCMAKYEYTLDVVNVPGVSYQSEVCVFDLWGQPLVAVGADKVVVANRPQLAQAFEHVNAMETKTLSGANHKLCWSEASQGLVGAEGPLMTFYN